MRYGYRNLNGEVTLFQWEEDSGEPEDIPFDNTIYEMVLLESDEAIRGSVD